ncbi:hypothetical protein EG829_11265, partial [bacterium]|nr:hypothetical protein [bacterium]
RSWSWSSPTACSGPWKAPAELLLKSGSRIQLKIPKGAVFHGDTGVGAYRISAHDVSRIVIH